VSTASAPPAVTGWGFLDIDAEDYHADPAPRPSLSSGLLAKIVTGTIAEAKESHPRLTPREEGEDDNKKFDIGTVAHTLVLGKGREIDVIDAEAWTKKADQEARKASKAAGRTPVLAKQFEQATAMRTALFEQLADMKGEQDTFSPEQGVAEQAGFWQEMTPLGKMWGRALYDWRATGRLVIRDYKTYAGQLGADPDGFIKGLISTGKDVQDPWYSRGYAAIAGFEAGEDIPWDAVDFKFIVQDPNPPYLVCVVALNDRHWSFERSQWAIDRWAAAAGANLWRGFVPTVHYVDPPVWAKTAWEQRMLREWEGEQQMLEQGMPALALKEPDAYRAEQAA
jgi:hypothetical protein